MAHSFYIVSSSLFTSRTVICIVQFGAVENIGPMASNFALTVTKLELYEYIAQPTTSSRSWTSQHNRVSCGFGALMPLDTNYIVS
jgi:hypothetical protein